MRSPSLSVVQCPPWFISLENLSLALPFALPQSRHEFGNTDNSPPHGTASYFLNIIACCHSHGIELAVKGFQHSFRLHSCANTTRRPMLHMNCCSNRNFIALTIGLQSMKRGGLHQPDHIWCRVHGRQRCVVSS